MENLTLFVRQVLGCNCPEAVFKHIENARDISLPSGIVLRNRIRIGNRLLIYVVSAETEAFMKDSLPELVRAGRDERDRLGFNRFRLVLASDNPEALEKTAERTFNALPYLDDNIHLHLVEKSAVSLLEGNGPAASRPPRTQI